MIPSTGPHTGHRIPSRLVQGKRRCRHWAGGGGFEVLRDLWNCWILRAIDTNVPLKRLSQLDRLWRSNHPHRSTVAPSPIAGPASPRASVPPPAGEGAKFIGYRGLTPLHRFRGRGRGHLDTRNSRWRHSLRRGSLLGPVGPTGNVSTTLEPIDSKGDPPPAPLKKGGRPARRLRPPLGHSRAVFRLCPPSALPHLPTNSKDL